jgi:glycine/D-amino acid oxidase-like deaminating enzyme
MKDINFSSPWIHQLNFPTLHKKIEQNFSTDVAVIGAGIAGVSTAYFALKNTSKQITIIEAYKVAHGATGHNGGQMVSYFEHPFADLVEKYGMSLAAKAQEDIFMTWDLVEQIFKDEELKTPINKVTGYAGCTDVKQINLHLRNIKYQREAGLDIEGVLVANIPEVISQIPEEYSELYARVDHEYILKILETENKNYVGALASLKGCMNSALFCEELIEVMLKKYQDRFAVYENSAVDSITLNKKAGVVHVGDFSVEAERIVLCTNGFENFTIQNAVGKDINTKFHDLVIGTVGYMAAFLEEKGRDPVAISYFSHKGIDEKDPYFYFTRRPYKHKQKGDWSLVSIGGPEQQFPHKSYYERERLPYPESAVKEIDDFFHSTYKFSPKEDIDYLFYWHGLMGYTPNGLRCIGPEPINPVLMYNLGCNGVGLLSSIYGGFRISRFLNKKKLEKSIFDPIS